MEHFHLILKFLICINYKTNTCSQKFKKQRGAYKWKVKVCLRFLPLTFIIWLVQIKCLHFSKLSSSWFLKKSWEWEKAGHSLLVQADEEVLAFPRVLIRKETSHLISTNKISRFLILQFQFHSLSRKTLFEKIFLITSVKIVRTQLAVINHFHWSRMKENGHKQWKERV